MKTQYTLSELLRIDNEDICLKATCLLGQGFPMHSTWEIELKQVLR